MLGAFCLPAKESDLCPGKDAAPLMSLNRGVTGSDPTGSGRRAHCCWDSLENWGEGSSLLKEKGSEHFLTFSVMACK